MAVASTPAIEQAAGRSLRRFVWIASAPLALGVFWLAATEAGDPTRAAAGFALACYAAALLSFVAGMRWGISLSRPQPPVRGLQLAVGTLAPIAAWLALLAQPPLSFAVLAAAYAAQGAWDAYLADAPDWFRRMRRTTTLVGVAALVAAFAATA